MGERLRAALKAAGFYATWYPKQWLPLELFKVRAARNTQLSRRNETKADDAPVTPKSDQGASRSTLHAPRLITRHLRYASRMSRKLGRSLFHAMVRNGPKLEHQQL